MYQMGFFEVEESYARIDVNNPLKKIQEHINWSGLESIMKKVSFNVDKNGGKGGRKPLCGLMMAKIFILQSLYNLCDDTMEFMIEDRLSFKKFLNIPVGKKSPDAKTIWVWRERVKVLKLEEEIFKWFSDQVLQAGYMAKEGQIIDATFVPTHKPTGKHKKQQQEGSLLSPHQERQQDTDATFTKKGGATHHGYKNHMVIDVKHKIIWRFDVTTASVHDSRVFEDLLTQNTPSDDDNDKDKGRGVWADSAYRSVHKEKMLHEKGFISHVCERGYKGMPLTLEQKKSNKEKSRIRARVEHVFGHIKTSMGGLMIHTLTLARAKVKITFKNLAYNMWRFAFLQTSQKLKT